MLTLAVLGFNLLGDGLRDAFDPRYRDDAEAIYGAKLDPQLARDPARRPWP